MRSGDRKIHIGAPSDAVWQALVKTGRRDWYFGLTPKGAFEPGGHIRWVDGAGRLAVEADVTEVRPGRLLVWREHYVFAPNLAAMEPHLVRWEVAPADAGCEVTIAWQADGVVAALVEGDATNVLRGLRLALDPAAQAEIARRDSIGAVDVRDVTAARVSDYAAFFDHDAFRDYPSWQFCYCMETHRTQNDEEWAARTADDNRRDMALMLAEGKVTALLAYADGKPVGWCNYGETTRLAGVMHRFGFEAADLEGVGSIACFVIAAPYRGHGVASRLLDEAVDRLRTRGVQIVEAYPSRSSSNSAQSLYRGPLSMFLRAGFEPFRETERYIVVRKTL
ncbi:MAG TPA: GNAT family N-acetyltransferase [Candidatus Dormibacteraeota bacterium]|nr:GNAT family N-acetyltransferase [Candidatus Dormibacteraeota bacterium]